MQTFLDFAEFERIWSRLRPETPFGRDGKAKQRFFDDAAQIETLWEQTAAAEALLQACSSEPLRLVQLSYHLQRLPRFPDSVDLPLGEVEFFEVKKFLSNYVGIRKLLTPKALAAFQLPEAPAGLLDLLDQGRPSAETFYLSDAYSEELATIRKSIREVDQALETMREEHFQEIATRLGLVFGVRPFLIIERKRLPDFAAAQAVLDIEPYDQSRILVRPQIQAREWALRETREDLQARERLEEEKVLQYLGQTVREALPSLLACRDAISTLDLALARAKLARELKLVRPTLTEGPMRIVQGRFLPCEDLCAKLKISYVPLDAEFADATVIFGSNMGGKTIVLKTVAFLQSCVQAGLYVPAQAFSTRVYRHLHFVGENAGEHGQGLSGFGREIRRVVEVLQNFAGGTLLLFDEFARTTTSREAEALLGALLERLTTMPGVRTLCSTHLRGLVRAPNIAYLRMAGLRPGALVESMDDLTLEERIRRIDQLMDYRLLKDEGREEMSDAMAIASMLGLSLGITSRAVALLKAGRRRSDADPASL